MKKYFQKSVSALAMGVLVMSGVTVSTVGLSSVPAFSKSSNSSSGGGNGKSGSARGGNSGRDNADRSNRGSTASSLGALNAAHANANAFANAAENSRVGLIALYQASVVASAEAEQAVIDAQEAYKLYVSESLLELVFLTEEEYDTAVSNGDVLLTEEEITYWEDLKLLQGTIDLAKEEVIALEELEVSALEAAANKETDGDVIAALWELLGLPPELPPEE